MKIIPILILSIFLTGCGWLESFRHKDPPAITPETVNIDTAALQYCELLKEDLVIKNFQESLEAYGDLANKYATCANKQATSVKLLKKFSNTK